MINNIIYFLLEYILYLHIKVFRKYYKYFYVVKFKNL